MASLLNKNQLSDDGLLPRISYFNFNFHQSEKTKWKEKKKKQKK